MKQDDRSRILAREITLDGITKRVLVAGSGPAVIVMAEMPGISPHVARFARWVRDAGFTNHMPSLFGRGAVPDADFLPASRAEHFKTGVFACRSYCARAGAAGTEFGKLSELGAVPPPHRRGRCLDSPDGRTLADLPSAQDHASHHERRLPA